MYDYWLFNDTARCTMQWKVVAFNSVTSSILQCISLSSLAVWACFCPRYWHKLPFLCELFVLLVRLLSSTHNVFRRTAPRTACVFRRTAPTMCTVEECIPQIQWLLEIIFGYIVHFKRLQLNTNQSINQPTNQPVYLLSVLHCYDICEFKLKVYDANIKINRCKQEAYLFRAN